MALNLFAAIIKYKHKLLVVLEYITSVWFAYSIPAVLAQIMTYLGGFAPGFLAHFSHILLSYKGYLIDVMITALTLGKSRDSCMIETRDS